MKIERNCKNCEHIREKFHAEKMIYYCSKLAIRIYPDKDFYEICPVFKWAEKYQGA